MQPAIVLLGLGFSALTCIANGCSDMYSICPAWAAAGLCEVPEYPPFCQKSCGNCGGGIDGGGGGGGGAGGGGDGGGSIGGSEKCGYKPSVRIFGGTEAPKGAWPWQAQIRSYFTKFAFCGGTLVHPQFVITAAHCVVKRTASTIEVRLGAHKRRGEVGTEQDFRVERIITHPSYKQPYGLAHDIAILKLEKPAVLNRAVNLACLPGSSGSVAVGKMCWVTGFGRLSSSGARPEVLMQVSVPVVSQASCIKAYGSSLIHDSMICAGFKEGGKGACQGVSGGPMVCESKGKFYLEGVVSWSIECAAPGKYGVYARVRYLRQWVDSTISRY